MRNITSKPTESLSFDFFPSRTISLIEDLNKNLDEVAAENLRLIIEQVYKNGFKDGMDFVSWLGK